jgi:hypothetical protein
MLNRIWIGPNAVRFTTAHVPQNAARHTAQRSNVYVQQVCPLPAPPARRHGIFSLIERVVYWEGRERRQGCYRENFGKW